MQKPIPILFTITNFITSGSGQVMMNIVTRLDRNLFAPAVCVFKKGGRLDRVVEEMGIPFIEAPFTIPAKPYLSLYKRSKRASEVFRPYKFALWHSWHYIDDYTEPIIAKLSGAKAWVFTKKNMSWGSNGWLVRSLLADRIGVDNTDMNAEFFTRFNLAKKTRYIPHGIPTDQFSPLIEPKLALREKLGIPADAVVVGCVANLTERKGHHILLEAVAKVPNVYLLTIGKTLEEDYALRLEDMRQSLQIEDRTFLLGHVDDVPAFLAEVDIFVLPTWNRGSREGCPVALVEAMSSGKACIATDIPGSKDIIENEVSGLIVPAEDVEALAIAINRFSQNSEMRKTFSLAARKRILDRFSIEQEVSRYQNLYLECLQGTGNKDL